jgi:sec-independent protein translocase protein TatC
VFGVVFELPVLMFLLGRLGIVRPSQLKRYRGHALVIIFVAAAALTPPDPITQLSVGVPLYALFELSILVSSWFERRPAPESAGATDASQTEAPPPAGGGSDVSAGGEGSGSASTGQAADPEVR